MSFIHDLKVKYHWYKFNNAVKNLRADRTSVNFTDARTVGILFDATDLAQRESVLKFAKALEKQDKKVKLLGFVRTKEDSSNLSFPNFNLKDLNLALLPEKSAVVQDFTSRDFDILLNPAPVEVIPLEYISALSKAKYRVGPVTEKTVCYELMIDVSENKTTDAFFKQAMHFLGKMNKQSAV